MVGFETLESDPDRLNESAPSDTELLRLCGPPFLPPAPGPEPTPPDEGKFETECGRLLIKVFAGELGILPSISSI